jgi:7-cyano-7-deazaguanine synthase
MTSRMPSLKLPQKTVVMVSGGIDSITLCYALRPRVRELRAVYADYGQENSIRGRMVINKMSVALCVPVEYMDLSGMVKSFAGFLPTPYDEHLVIMCETHGYSTVLGPSQSAIPQFFAITGLAATYAVSIGYDALVTGYNKTDLDEDASRYRSIREVNRSVGQILTHADRKRPFELPMPFAAISKGDVIQLAQRIRVPLDDTWSCWANTPRHCGLCPGCYSRRRAFTLAKVPDPTVYLSEPTNDLLHSGRPSSPGTSRGNALSRR